MKTSYLDPRIYNTLYTCMTYENVLALRVCLETGLRIDDVLSITAEQLKGRTLRGTAEKTGKPYKKTISYDLAKRLHNIADTGYFFPHRTKEGEHRTRQAVWANMKQAAKRMGVEVNAAPHSARKTYAVEVFNDRGLEAARTELQHDNINTTMIYAFSNILSKNVKNGGFLLDNQYDIDYLADKIAEKVAKILEKKKNLG